VRLSILILKWIFQIITAAGGVIAVFRTQTEIKNDKKRLTFPGKLAITGIVVTFVLFVIGDLSQRREISELRLNRELTGIEISFTPSAEDWSRIEAAYNKIPPEVKEVTFSGATLRDIPFSQATMKAERNGDSWKIDFEPLRLAAGFIQFRPVLPSDPSAKAFTDVIQEASPSLWIKWGSNVTSEIEPRRNQHPSAISISQNMIALTLRSPELKLKLNQMDDDNFIILIRANSQPAKLRIKSLDEGVVLDQTLDMNWKRDENSLPSDPEGFIKVKNPFVSGPHKLQLQIKS